MRKTEKEKKSNDSFLFYFFMLEKLYFVRKDIWKNLVYIVTFALPFFHVAGYWKCSNTNAHIYNNLFCRRDTSSKIFNIRLDILT